MLLLHFKQELTTPFQTSSKLICEKIQRERGSKLLKQTKQTKQRKQKLRRSKNNTIVDETIKTKCLDRPELFIDEEGDALGIPKLCRLYLLDISCGDTMVTSPS